MTDDLTLAARALGIDEDEVRVLALLPLVQVAWADGEVQGAERSLILRLATERYGLDEDARRILETWLTYPPTEGYFAAGRDLLLRLVRAQRVPLALADGATVDVVAGHARDVARAAGGLLGFRAIDPREQAALDAIQQAIEAHHAEPPPLAAEVFDPPTLADQDADDRTDPSLQSAVSLARTLDEDETDIFSGAELDALSQYRPDAGITLERGIAGLVAHVGDVEVPYPLREELRIGRHGDNDVSIPSDHRASRHHARIYRDGDRVYLADLGTTNGTHVNGERVVERRLFGGEEIRIGSTLLTWLAGT